jgi:hypothetical protein
MYEPFDTDLTPMEEPASSLPGGLGEMAPGPELGRMIATLDLEPLSSADRVAMLVACRKLISHYQARFYRELGTLLSQEIAEAESDEEGYWMVATEIEAALHLSRASAQRELERALELERVPRVFEALLSGRLDLYRGETVMRNS